jgi:DNA modification methylase
MADLPADSIPMWITSPPYDKLRTYKGYTFKFEAIARQLWRVTAPGGVGVWVVADETKDGSESGTSFRQALYFMELGFNLHDTMIYEVAGTGAKGSNKAYWQAFEFMFVFSKGEPRTVNRIADRKKTQGGGSRRHANGRAKPKRNRVEKKESIKANIWRYAVGSASGDDDTDHPAPFPEALARDHILSWSNPGDLVLDPMTGSGTTCKMAYLTGRNFLGFEISEEYCQIARRRLEATMSQTALFNPYQVETPPAPVQSGLWGEA